MKELWSLFPRSSSGSVTSNSPQAIGSPSMSSRLMQFAGFDFSNIDPSTLFDPASGLVFPGADLRLNIPQNPSTSFGQLARVNLDRNTLDSLQGDPLLALTGAGPATERIPVCRITALPSVDVERPGLPKGLTVADLPDIPADFYVHLITIFFSYFHQALPIINERQFFIEIMPENTHHAMLLNAIYAIGCLFSRHSTLFQAPFYGPHRASEYFANRAAGLIPTFAKTMSSFEKVSICQAALLLSVLDYGSRNAVRSWMYTGMGCRLSQKLDLPFSRTVNDFFSICNGVPKPAVVSSMEERKRVWWASFVIDTYVSISTGMNFLLNENDYFESLVDVEHLLSHDGAKFSGGDPVPSPPNSGSWVDIFCNKPYPTVFDSGRGMQDPVPVAASEVLSSTEETLHLVQLCFIIRKVFRFNKFPKNTTPSLTPNSVLLASLLSRPMDVNRLHDTLICWYEGLPSSFRLFDVLDRKPSFPLSSPKMTKPSSLCITVNLLFFTAVVLLHYRNLKKVDGAGLSPIQADSSFRMSSNGLNTSLYTSAEVCAVAYKCQCQIVRIAYGGTNATPSPSSRPPPELVSCPLVQCFLLPVATALLSQFQYGSQLTSLDVRPLSDYSTQLESLHALFLPVLDNIAQVWPTARSYAANLRSQSQIFREKWKGLL
ncbi:fungal-specific transcription factor domain-containing protein [Zopfochytrium polystomum]|nr:fungal-specific transcription factor domain-containing protein [Zopfochytrium polystomum]